MNPETYLNIWSTYTTIINNQKWYITDLYDHEVEDLNLNINNNLIVIQTHDMEEAGTIFEVWINEKLLDILYLKCNNISMSPKITMDEEYYKYALKILQDHTSI